MIGHSRCYHAAASLEATKLLTPAQLEQLLHQWPIGHLATLGADGAPSIVPVVFVFVDGAIFSPVDGKPKRSSDLQRLKNVARDPRCSLLLDHYSPRWEELWWVRLACNAAVRSPSETDPEALSVQTALRTKYPQYRSVAPLRTPIRLLRLVPQSHTAWSAAPVDWAAQRASVFHGGV